MPVSCPSLLLYCVIWLCSKFVQCHESPAQLIPCCRASGGATERGKSQHTPSLPLLLSQETDRGNLCTLKDGTEGNRWGWDRKISLGESKGCLSSNCYIAIANLIPDPTASPRTSHFFIKSLSKIHVLCPQQRKTPKSTVSEWLALCNHLGMDQLHMQGMPTLLWARAQAQTCW